MRSLLRRFDRAPLPLLAPLGDFVGPWISRFLSAAPAHSGAERFLLSLFSAPSLRARLEAAAEQPAPVPWAQRLVAATGFRAPGSAASLIASLEAPDLAFCAVAAGVWCALLGGDEAAGSPMRGEVYPRDLGTLFLPALPPSQIEHQIALLSIAGVAAYGQCTRCLTLFGIGGAGTGGPCAILTHGGRAHMAADETEHSAASCVVCRNPLGVNHQNNWVPFSPATASQRHVVGLPQEDWCDPQLDHTERNLTPLEYRLLCFFVLAPVAVHAAPGSPERIRHVRSLQAHWERLRAVGRFNSDTEVQQAVVAILSRALGGAAAFRDLAMVGAAFTDPSVSVDRGATLLRSRCEDVFRRGMATVLGTAAPDARSLTSLLGTVSQEVDRVEAEESPLDRLTEAAIAALPEPLQAERFAPSVLTFVLEAAPPDPVELIRSRVAELWAAGQEEVVRGLPVLVWALFSGPGRGALLPGYVDGEELALAEKARHLITLCEGLSYLQRVAENAGRAGRLPGLLGRSAQAALTDYANFAAFNDAWEECRRGLAIGHECEGVADAGGLEELLVEDLLVAVSGPEAPPVTRGALVLGKVLSIHNKQVAECLGGLAAAQSHAVDAFVPGPSALRALRQAAPIPWARVVSSITDAGRFWSDGGAFLVTDEGLARAEERARRYLGHMLSSAEGWPVWPRTVTRDRWPSCPLPATAGGIGVVSLSGAHVDEDPTLPRSVSLALSSLARDKLHAVCEWAAWEAAKLLAGYRPRPSSQGQGEAADGAPVAADAVIPGCPVVGFPTVRARSLAALQREAVAMVGDLAEDSLAPGYRVALPREAARGLAEVSASEEGAAALRVMRELCRGPLPDPEKSVTLVSLLLGKVTVASMRVLAPPLGFCLVKHLYGSIRVLSGAPEGDPAAEEEDTSGFTPDPEVADPQEADLVENKVVAPPPGPGSDPADPTEADRPGFIPQRFLCPVLFSLFQDPVTAADKVTYEREFIEPYIARKRALNHALDSPSAKGVLSHGEVVPNVELKAQIDAWKAANPNWEEFV